MTLEEFKREISNRTGIPVLLITGETEEEAIAKAKALLAYKREQDELRGKERPTDTRKLFADWMQEKYGEEETRPDIEAQALEDLENSLLVAPKVQDGGAGDSQKNIGDGRSTAEHFADWAARQLSYNPFQEGGWKPL